MTMSADFTAELARYGPGTDARPPSLVEARRYCERLAKGHYENFTVASLLLPRSLRRHFYNVYAWCRWADDLADETGGAAESLPLLDWWERQLADCYRGRARHPVLVALMETIEEFDLPQQPFLDLLSAFRQDQRKTRYETFDELRDYCRRSADPVGRIVLRLGRCHDEENLLLSDSICTGLQLANFWQDVARDYARGRIYLPRSTQRQFGCTDEDFAQPRASERLTAAVANEVDRAERLLLEGRPLASRVPRDLRLDVELFVRGGLAVLAAIRRQGCDVLKKRPTVGRLTKLRLIWSAWRGRRL